MAIDVLNLSEKKTFACSRITRVLLVIAGIETKSWPILEETEMWIMQKNY